MKTFISILALTLLIPTSQNAQDNRLAYSYISVIFEKAIVEHLDDDKLTAKEEKLYKKFMKHLHLKSTIQLESYLTEKLSEKGYRVLPLNTVHAIGNSAINLNGFPSISFPKKTLKKHMDKDLADYFISASLSIAKPIIAVIGMKPSVTVTIKIFDKTGVLIEKHTAIHKTEKKISNIGFAVKQSEDFSKVDISHAEILFSKIEPALKKAINDTLSQLGQDQ